MTSHCLCCPILYEPINNLWIDQDCLKMIHCAVIGFDSTYPNTERRYKNFSFIKIYKNHRFRMYKDINFIEHSYFCGRGSSRFNTRTTKCAFIIFVVKITHRRLAGAKFYSEYGPVPHWEF